MNEETTNPLSGKVMQPRTPSNGASIDRTDVIVIGAGFAGIRSLHEMRSLGLSVRVLEKGHDVGGTWYWNRYPGARADMESWVYCYSFDESLAREWQWSHRFASQPELRAYLQFVVDRLDMRKDIEFDCSVTAAHFDDTANAWRVTTAAGMTYTATYLVTAVGILSEPVSPPFLGIDTFKGEKYLTSRWPAETVSFDGKRVAVIGTGSSAVGLIPEAAQTAEQLLVFQRTPTYVLPARDFAIDPCRRTAIQRDYDAILAKKNSHAWGLSLDRPERLYADCTPEQVDALLERGWEIGGLEPIYTTFDDLLSDPEANARFTEFLRAKIRKIVTDPEVAELLCPTHAFFSKRPPLGHRYYETFNRANVSLIDIKSNAIAELTDAGIHLQNGDYHEVDMIVFATGFDAVTGALTSIDIRGLSGKTLRDNWLERKTRALYGMFLDDYPNLFMVCGPHSPYANMVPIIEHHVSFAGRTINYLLTHGLDRIEARSEAVDKWRERVETIQQGFRVLPAGESYHSWFVGANVDGKPRDTYFYFGGADTFYAALEAEIDQQYPGLQLSKAEMPSPSQSLVPLSVLGADE
jgi:cation diffusion facilitator CzcD-associated flavoprotein CzcO